MQFGIFTVGDVTTDPTTGRTPTEHERIKNILTIAKHAEEVGLLDKVDLNGLYDLKLLNEVLKAKGETAVTQP